MDRGGRRSRTTSSPPTGSIRPRSGSWRCSRCRTCLPPPETNNYFVQAPFMLNRWTLDTKTNWNATDRMNVFGRFSVLDFFTENGTNFGRELQGQALGSSNPGTGDGQHLQRLGRRYLHDDADAPDGRARRLRPHEHRRRAIGHRRAEGSGLARSAGHQRPARLRGRDAALRSRHATTTWERLDKFMPYYRERRSVPDGA